MKRHLSLLKNNISGFTFVELLIVIVIMAVLVASSANYLFSQGGSKARDVERKNDMKQVAALIEQFSASYGEPPNSNLKNRKALRYDDCKAGDYQTLMQCFKELRYAGGEGIVNLAEDPKQGIENDEGKVYQYLYGANNNGWKICALLENQTDPDLNDSYDGSGEFSETEGERAYCVVASNRKLDYITDIEAGDFDVDALEN